MDGNHIEITVDIVVKALTRNHIVNPFEVTFRDFEIDVSENIFTFRFFIEGKDSSKSSRVIVIFSIVIGSVAGEMIGLEARLIRVGEWLKGRLKSSNPQFTEGMVNASVLFCIGAMAIIGSFDEGLRGDRAVVLSETIIDSFAALAMASAYGLGVLFSAIPVLIYQGALTLLAGSLQSWLDPAAMTELTAVGGTLIIGIGLNMLEITRISLSNMLPPLLAPVGLCALAASFAGTI